MEEVRAQRFCELSRKTNETDVYVSMKLDGSGACDVDTGIPFFDHMLEQLGKHSGFDLVVRAKGDKEIDAHHTVEDVGIVLGKALFECIRDKTCISRYGSALLSMDESLCMAAVDFCGRANLVYNCAALTGSIGNFDTQNIKEFFKAFVSNAFITLHLNLMYGENAHHNAECIFKAAARTLKEAAALNNNMGILSTKGCL